MSELACRAMRPDPADLARFSECFSRNGSPRTAEQLRWQYFQNPTGRLYVDLALAPEGHAAAIYASLPVFARMRGRRQLALQSLDTLTDQAHRGKGLFLKLARSLFHRAAEDGAAFIYGFPNGNSAHGFFNRLEWESLDPVPFLIRPLRTRYVFDRLKLGERIGMPGIERWLPDIPLQLAGAPCPPGYAVEEVSRFDGRFDALWSAMEGDVAVDRGAAYLNWRLVDKPGESYRRVAIVRRGRVEAFVSWCVKDKHGGRVGYVMEVLHRPSSVWAAWVLLQRALLDMTRERADVALAWCFDHSRPIAAYHWSGFVPFPERLRPIELHVGARAFAEAARSLVGDRRGWYLSYLDSDTV